MRASKYPDIAKFSSLPRRKPRRNLLRREQNKLGMVLARADEVIE
jgi:hypothetical protein